MTDPEPTAPELEAYVAMPNGGFAPRCQRVKENKTQCRKPSRRGRRVCSSHGAGYRSREAAGERKTPGRPVQHGIYSSIPTRSYAETMEEVSTLEDILTSSDRELIALKSVLVYEIGRLEALTPDVQAFEANLEAYVAETEAISDEPLTPAEAMRLARRFASWLKPLTALDRAVGRVSDTSTKSIVAHKVRAETKAKLAETEGLTVFMRLNSVQRAIFHALAPNEELTDAYESALLREVYGPQRLEIPALDMTVLDYPVEKPGPKQLESNAEEYS